MKRYAPPHVIVTDKLRSYGAAMKVIGNVDKQGNRPLAEQQGREFTSAFSTKRAGDVALQTNANIAEIRLRPLFGPQSFQPGTPPLQPRKLQA